MINLIIRGCNGKLGQVISEIAENDSEIKVVAGIDLMPRKNGENSYPVFEHLGECTVLADVVVDCSSPKGLTELLSVCRERKMAIVLCTTGFSEEQLAEVEQASRELAILRSANMSLGINTLAKLAEAAAKIFAEAGFDIEIVEKHHNQKLDAPSGTAVALADAINEAENGAYTYVYDRSQVRKKREAKELGISAVRGGTIVGDHDVIFAGTDEVLTFEHRAYSRAVFGKGAIQAAKFLAGKPAGRYDMSDVIG